MKEENERKKGKGGKRTKKKERGREMGLWG